ncbi:MAG TPA: SDR family NAD(P)-dependent oxidoreductase [Candidatus Sulfotelmatobacter sp.]|nr:SDR family NAD(P)-dependent oxidoreductase [Candidatus Sulfotelmatobacter sp.]
MRLADRVALVTGSGAGIGRAIAIAMAKEGADLLIADIRGEAAEAVAKAAEALDRRAAVLQVDVSREADVRHAIAEGLRLFGRIDILVNNAGINPGLGLPFSRQVEADWDRVFNVNVKSVFFTCKHLAPHLMERRTGKIVNIASIAGPLSSQTMPSYSVAKMGVVTFTKIVAKDLARYNVNANVICPGLLWTDMWKNIGEVIRETNPAYTDLTPREMFERRVAEWIPMKREQTPEDIANAAVFLASEEARNITGQALMVDGGVVM